MIRSAILFAVVFFLLLFVGVPANIAAGIGSAIFVLSIPFSLIFGWAERSRRQAEDRNEALADIARGIEESGRNDRVRSAGPCKIIKDDRAVFIDNRQVNIYNGSDAAEGASYGTEERNRRSISPC